ncbi:MAG: Papain-like cysteine protease AvrRpt2 [Pseudomonadota bacterium]|jgi:hypothetical protein
MQDLAQDRVRSNTTGLSCTVRIALAATIGLCPLAPLVGCASTPPITVRREPSPDGLIQQRRSDWCWAACCEMAYRARGHADMTQEKLVAAFKQPNADAKTLAGSDADHRVQDFELVRALAVGTDFELPIGFYPGGGISFNRGGLAQYLHAWASLYVASSVAIEDLERNQPVLAVLRDWEGAPGHVGFVIEIAATPDSTANALSDLYTVGSRIGNAVGVTGGQSDSISRYLPEKLPHQYTLHRITFYDPSLDNPGIKTIEGDAIKRHLAYLLSPSMAQAILARERDIVKMGVAPTRMQVRRR